MQLCMKKKKSHNPVTLLCNDSTYPAHVRNTKNPLVFERGELYASYTAELNSQYLQDLKQQQIETQMKKRASGFPVCITSNTGYTNSNLQKKKPVIHCIGYFLLKSESSSIYEL